MKTSDKALERSKACELTIQESIRENNTTKHRYKCNSCNSEKTTTDSTLFRWFKQKLKYCPACRGAAKGLTNQERLQKLKDCITDYYSPYIEIVEYLGYRDNKHHSYCILKFKECGHTKEYNATTVKGMIKAGKAFKCDVCNETKVSAQESFVLNTLKKARYQIPYSDIINTDRKWVADYVLDNVIIEITTIGQLCKSEYLKNILEKTSEAAKQGFLVLTITNNNDIQDIVRTLSKDKESIVTAIDVT